MADELKNNHAAEHENAYNPTKERYIVCILISNAWN